MMRTTLYCAVWMIFAAGPCARADTPATQPSTIDPIADQVLHQCCDFLAAAPAFSVHAEIWKDEVLPTGHKIQVTREIDLDIRRPDHLHVDARAHRKGRAIWYDGKSLTVLDRLSSVYATVDAPPTIDQLLDFVWDTYGIAIPLEDLAISNPYANGMKDVTDGGYFGEESVLGVMCRHLAYSNPSIDWQLWVADGPEPLPQKLLITYKTQDQCPQYTAIFSKWSFPTRASDLAFQFIPPPGGSKVEMQSLKSEGREP